MINSTRGGFVVGLIVFIIVAALIVGGVVFFVLSRLDSIVEKGIEEQGSALTKTEVQVGAVEISLKSGRGTLTDITVGNPEGFPEGNAFSLGEIALQIDIKSLTNNPVIIEEILIRSPGVSYLVDTSMKSNIDIIKKNVEQAVGDTLRGADTKGDKKFIIRRFTFENGQVTVDATAIGRKTLSFELPSVLLTDLGGSDGASPEAIGKKVVSAFTAEIARAVAEKGFKALLQNKLEQGLNDKLGDKAKDVLKGLFK